MPFRVRCPRCGQTAEITEEHLGRQGQCNNCGSLVSIPARLSKRCVVCGVDVTHLAHTKDEQSNYLCIPCFESRQSGTASASSFGRLECSICHIYFPSEQSTDTDDPICRDCATILRAHQSLATIPIANERLQSNPANQLGDIEPIRPLPRPPNPQVYVAPTIKPNRISSQRLPLILSSLGLVGVIVLGILHFASSTRQPSAIPSASENPDQQTLTHVLILKSQAEVLLEVGKPREAVQKYDELLAISSSNPTIAAELDSAKSAREKALKVLAASMPPRTSVEKTVTIPDPQKKAGTIFNE